jgi:hypothetical protein
VRAWWVLPAAALMVLPTAAAHGVGFGSPVETRFTLPPWVVWSAGALVVAVSFLVVAGFLTRRDLGAGHADRSSAGRHRRPWTPARTAGLAVLALAAANAWVPQNQGIVPQTTLWILVWAALPIVCYVGGNAWEVINPFRPLGDLADRLRAGRPPQAYPAAASMWPAAVGLLVLIGLEVATPAAQEARPLAVFLATYATLVFVGSYVYGSDAWLGKAEVFTRFFEWWSHAAPRYGARAAAPGSRLASLHVRGHAGVAFTVALLYGVNFDGLLATGPGSRAEAAMAGALGPAAAWVLLVAGFLVFLAVYHTCVLVIRRTARTLDPHAEVAARFAPALVPIAVGYHAAHNLVNVIENLPLVVAMWADPLGLGWQWFTPPGPLAISGGLYTYLATLQMVLILAGHVAAVVVGHRLALGGFPSRVQAVRSEVPLTGVMVAYTLVGLWIVSQASGVVG